MTTSSFERHNIGHLSASSINLFVAAPSLWLMEKVVGIKGKVGAAAHRGSAVESGISHGLFDHSASAEACQAVAMASFDRLTALSGDSRREKERDMIPGMIEQGLALREKGNPMRPNLSDQHKIEVRLEGVPVPIIGYLDFEFADEVIDTKTTNKIPSEMPAGHARQFSLYKHAKMNKRMRGAYISPKRMEIHTLTREQYEKSLAEIVAMSQRMERFLALSDDAQELAAIIPHDPSSFYWNDASTAEAGHKLFGY